MTYFLGYRGKIKLSRRSRASFRSSILPADVNTSLNRVGFDGSVENLLTGDKIILTTTDARGLDFLPSSTWPDGGGATLKEVEVYCNVNGLGGLRLFREFSDAVNNVRANELPLEAFAGAALSIDVTLFDPERRVLGDVTGFNFNTDREALDTTTMSDRFKKMYAAGLISGAGSIDCLFNPSFSGLGESSLLMLQLINRADIGSEFSCYLQLTENEVGAEDVYYEFGAMVTRSGIEVRADQAITCAIDFVTTGEIRLVIGEPPADYLLKEDDDRIRQQQNLDYLLTEVGD